MSGFKTVEMRRLIKRILKFYIDKQFIKKEIKRVFLKHYRIKEVVRGERILRIVVHQKIENELRVGGSPAFRNLQKQCLIELGIVPTFCQGYRYYAGLADK